MYKSEYIIINEEFNKSIRYLESRKEKVSTEEYKQELGHLRNFVYQIYLANKK